MRIKSVLLVSWEFPPSSSPKAAKTEAILKEMISLGFNVSLLTRATSDIIHKYYRENIEEIVLLSRNNWPVFDVEIGKSHRLGLNQLKRILNGLLLKFLAYPNIQAFFWISRSVHRLKKDSYDIVLSVDGPQQMHWGLAWAIRKSTLKTGFWIADCGDPLTRKLLGNKVAPYFKLIENWFCSTADALTVPVPQGYGYFHKKFKGKIHIIPHSLDFPEIKISGSKKNSKVSFGYGGNMMPYQFEAKELFKSLSQIDQNFKFNIYGGNEKFVQGILKNYPTSLQRKVKLHGKLSRSNLLEKLKSENEFLIYLKFSGTDQVSFKLIDYAFVDLPVLQFESDEQDRFKIMKFLNGDFKYKMQLKSYLSHSSKHTVPQYLRLANA